MFLNIVYKHIPIYKDPAENDISRTDAEYPHLRLFIAYLTVSWVIICVSVYELLYPMNRNQRVLNNEIIPRSNSYIL